MLLAWLRIGLLIGGGAQKHTPGVYRVSLKIFIFSPGESLFRFSVFHVSALFQNFSSVGKIWDIIKRLYCEFLLAQMQVNKKEEPWPFR